MIRIAEDFCDYKFESSKEYKDAVLSVLQNELEVFDPICDGDVRLSEGLAYLAEDVERFFKKERTPEEIESGLVPYLRGRKRFCPGKVEKEGYENGIGIVSDVLQEICEFKCEQAYLSEEL